MKVLALVILAVASASGKGSGPYLPSGWRPEGPAFFLPSEVKSSENPLVDVILAGSEASGSDSLREYGPPKVQEVSQNLINQGLPDVAIEQTFESVSPVAEIKEIISEENAEAKTETPTEQSLTTTESVVLEEISVNLPTVETESTVEFSQTTVANGVENTVANDVETTSSKVEVTQPENVYTSEGAIENVGINQQSEISSQESSQDVASVVEVTKVTETIVSTDQQEATDVALVSKPTEVIAVDNIIKEVTNLQQVQNIPDIIASLENEAKAQQTEINQAVSNLPTIQTAGSLTDAPEGFLEYGPPGFAEYGPPAFKEYGPPKNDAIEDKSANLLSFETKETRRRRFSPKFRLSKKH